MSEAGWVVVLAMLGLGYDRALLTILRKNAGYASKGLVVVLLNALLIFSVLVASYAIDGFVVHEGGLGEGWIDWVTLLTNFGAGYTAPGLLFLWRSLTGTGA